MKFDFRELLDVISHPTRSKDIDTQKLVELLLHKDKEMKATLEQGIYGMIEYQQLWKNYKLYFFNNLFYKLPGIYVNA